MLGRIIFLGLALLLAPHRARALSIISAPAFAQAVKAPLAGRLSFATDVPARVSVTVNDGEETWTRSFLDYQTNHSLPLLGFKPRHTNQISVTARDRQDNSVSTVVPLTFIAPALPSDFPVLNVLTAQPERMEPGYSLFRCVVGTKGYITVVNNNGEVVWYSSLTSGNDVRQLSNGDLLIPLPAEFQEVNMLGEIVSKVKAPEGLNIDTHDAVLTPKNTILYISDQTGDVPGFPTSATNPSAPKADSAVQYDRIVEVSAADGTVLNNWSLLDMLDPLRISYLTFVKTSQGWDIQHCNAVIEDSRDDSIIVSSRTQNAVFAFYRATGELKWILGPHENWGPEFQKYLLKPVGEPFEWNYAQHAPMITPDGTLLIYDDGNYRASPFATSVPDSQNYSRAVEYDINEETMEVRQVWEYGGNIDQQLYTGSVGNADWLPQTGNILINFGNISYVDHARPSKNSATASMARIKEVTHDANPEVVFDLALFDYSNTNSTYRGNWVYRCRRIPDLYGHPAVPVTDLTVSSENGVAHLTFSGDPIRSYTVEASSDLEHWTELGAAAGDETGNWLFDSDAGETEDAHELFYRVVTH